MKFLLSSWIAFLFATTISAQKSEYTSLSIPDSLKQNANAVVRLDQIDIVISSQRNMNVKQKRIVTVLNEKGQEAIDAYEYYNKKSSVEIIQATVFDGFGNEIKKIKRKRSIFFITKSKLLNYFILQSQWQSYYLLWSFG